MTTIYSRQPYANDSHTQNNYIIYALETTVYFTPSHASDNHSLDNHTIHTAMYYRHPLTVNSHDVYQVATYYVRLLDRYAFEHD